VRVTFSICAFDPQSGELGIAVQSKFLGVGAVVPWARAGVGAIATQSFANTAFGPDGLALLERGASPDDVARRLVENDPDREKRQFGIVDARGRVATYTGSECLEWAGGVTGERYCAQGNILAGPDVVRGMADAFESSRRPLADRLIAALHGGQRYGGDRRGMQSAALLVVKERGGYGGFNDRYIDLHVEDDARPIDELQRVLGLFKLYFKVEPVRVRPIDAAVRGELDGILARSGQRDLRELFGVENLEERWRDGDEVDEAALEFLRMRFPA
jgi:uncharacterized Ntn-hydrolase superfamily protein